MEMEVRLPGGDRVDTVVKGSIISVGGLAEKGSEGPGVEPLDLFFASLGLCAGKYVLEFCRSRNIEHKGISIRLHTLWDEEEKRHRRVTLDVYLPDSFPAKYEKALLRVIDLCSVKKHILNPPDFELRVSRL